jgi:hypothetical protein
MARPLLSLLGKEDAAMIKNPETSMMFALAELQRAEVARQSDEAAQRASHQKEQQERERAERERAREQELQTQRTAEAAARLRVQVEEREAAAQKRVLAMQEALITLKAERDVLQEHLHAQDSAPAPAQPSAVRWAMSGMALSLIAVAAMAIVMLLPPVRTRAQSVVYAVARAAPTAPAPVPLVAPGSPAAPGAPVAPVSPIKHHARPTGPIKPTQPPFATVLDPHCKDDPDPLCGIKFSSTTQGKR